MVQWQWHKHKSGITCSMGRARWLDLAELDVFGDSKLIVHWENIKHSLEVPDLAHWMERTRSLISTFDRISVQHIFREQNMEADFLSREGFNHTPGRISYSFSGGTFQRTGFIEI